MAWTDVNLKDVVVEKPDFPEIPLGTYTFELLPGAKMDDYNGVSVSAAVVTEGESRGRRAFFSFPDPTSLSQAGKPKSWSIQALKKFEVALGVEANDGESPTEYLNRAAGTRFGAEIKLSTRTKQDGSPRHELNIFSFTAAV